MKHALIIGAHSAIAHATACVWAKRGYHLSLLSRKLESPHALELKNLGSPEVKTHLFSAEKTQEHQQILSLIFSKKVDIVLLAFGMLPDQKQCEKDASAAISSIHINVIGAVSILTHTANFMERQKEGTLAVITSVAGDRGRKSNYIYGASKAMISVLTQGLRNRLCPSGVHVAEIKPGFVDTPMTSHFKKGLLWSKPQSIGKAIARCVDKKKNSIYAPFFWGWIMRVIRCIPECLFKKMNL